MSPQGNEKFRGSSEIPLTPDGVEKARQTGIQLAQKGGLDELMASSLGRTVHTARIISHYTHAPITYIGDALHPWHLGSLEGQDVTPEKVDLMNRLVKEAPDLQIPGRGPLSTSDGESFNDFKERTLPFLQGVMNKIQSDPNRKIGLVTHYRVRRLLEAWMRKGAGDDFEIDPDEMNRHDGASAPGSMERLIVDSNGPQIKGVDLKSPSALSGGAYFIRHEATPWNRPAGTPSTQS